MADKPGWLTYGRPQFHYIGGAVMAVFSVVGAFLTFKQILMSGLPWWGWMLTTLLGLGILIYAHMRQWRDWRREVDRLRVKVAGEARIVVIRPIPPPHEGYAAALEMVIQTNKPMSPVQIEFLCNRAVDGAKIWPRIQHAPPMYSVTSQAKGKLVGFLLSFPPFLPETPLIVTLETRHRVQVVDFVCAEATPLADPPPTTAE